MSFTIGEIQAGDDQGKTSVSIQDKGVSIYHYGRGMVLGGGMGTYTPAQARQLGQLLINAADRWTELNATVRQAEAEIEAAKRTASSRIKDFLS